jgi:hypothetical protein
MSYNSEMSVTVNSNVDNVFLAFVLILSIFVTKYERKFKVSPYFESL